MGDYRIKKTTLNAIADAVREKSGVTNTILGNDLAEKISALPKPDQINNSQVVTAVSENEIQIGDTVYYVNNGAKDIDGGEFYFSALSSRVNTAAFSPDGKTLVLGGDFTGCAKVYSVNGTTITYVSDIYTDAEATAVYTATFSPDGSTLVLGGYFTGKAKVYSVNNTTITYVSDIYADTGTTALGDSWGGNVNIAIFSPDGSTLVLGGEFFGHAKVYSVSGTTIAYVSDISGVDGNVETAIFSPDGKTLVLGGDFTGYAKVYSVNGTTITYVSDIYTDAETTALSSTVYTADFSPDGSTLVLGGYFTGRAKVFSVNGTTITFVSDIYADSGTTALSIRVETAIFSPDGSTLVLGGYKYAKVYSVNGTTITYVSDIYADTGTTALSNWVYTAALSPDGSTLVLGGLFTGYAKVYSVNGTTITFVSDIYADNGTATLSSTVRTAAFSPDGSTLVLGGHFTGKAKVYSVNGTTITYVSDIYADTGTTALSGDVYTAVFSPDGSTLVLSGGISGYAKVYSVNGTTITFVSNIYADTGTTALSGYAYTATFSPDGTTLVLGCYSDSRAKVYSVNGTTITYVSNIYADTGTTALSSYVKTAAFSPDGSTLVLGGDFRGRAKVYSVNGTTITFVSDIYADSGTTALSGRVETAIFSPDGSTLVLGGGFSGYAKVYSVNGTTITYVSDIYADTGTTALSNWVYTAALSPDGSTLVLGGGISGYAKVYSVNGTTITYISDIYADNGTTALSSTVYTATFSPDGSTLVLGGYFTGRATVYPINGTAILYIERAIYLAPDGTLSDLPSNAQIGYALSSANESEDITIKTIGTFISESGGDTSMEDGLIARTCTEYSNDRVSTVGSYAFAYCTSLATVSFSAATTIGGSAFRSCNSLITANFPAVTTIGYGAFEYCYSLTTVNFPAARTIDMNAFYSCSNLATVSFPAATTISRSAFCYCRSLTSVNFPALTSIGNSAFLGCYNLTSVSFPVATTIGSYAFFACTSLATVNFPAATDIGYSAFRSCNSLITANFPAATTIGSCAFSSCTSLTSLCLTGSSLCTLGNSNAFTSTPIASGTGYIYVPSSLLASYKTATNWTYFSSRISGI